jgi:hypothetical protein
MTIRYLNFAGVAVQGLHAIAGPRQAQNNRKYWVKNFTLGGVGRLSQTGAGATPCREAGIARRCEQ